MVRGVTERLLGSVVRANNRRLRSIASPCANPRPLQDEQWNTVLEARWPEIRAEWDMFVAAGGRLPRIEEVLSESQGNEGSWRAGLLVSNGRPVPEVADRFPVTVAALLAVPRLRSALWSELEPGAEIPEHRGPDAGVLRYHLGVRCGERSAVRVEDTVVPYRDGRGVLFDDTRPHEAWNRGVEPRVTLFCELYTPVTGSSDVLNRAVHALLAQDRRYRRAPQRAAEWDRALNRIPLTRPY